MLSKNEYNVLVPFKELSENLEVLIQKMYELNIGISSLRSFSNFSPERYELFYRGVFSGIFNKEEDKNCFIHITNGIGYTPNSISEVLPCKRAVVTTRMGKLPTITLNEFLELKSL